MKDFLFFVFVVSTLSFVSVVAQTYTAGLLGSDPNAVVTTLLTTNILFQFGVNPQNATATITKTDSIICVGNICNVTVTFFDASEIYPTVLSKNGVNETSLAFAVGHPYLGTAIPLTLPFSFAVLSISIIFYTDQVEKARFPAQAPSPVGLTGFGAYGNAPGQFINSVSLVWVVNATSPIPSSSAAVPTSAAPVVSPGNNGGNNNTVGLAVGLSIGLFALLVIVVLVAFFLFRRRKIASEDSAYRGNSEVLGGTKVDVSNYAQVINAPQQYVAIDSTYYGDLITSSEFKQIKVLGQGHFGDVYQADWNTTIVALKALKNDNMKQFMTEVDIMRKLNHPNIVRFYGVTKLKEQFYLVTEFCEYGDLRSLLTNKRGDIKTKQLHRLALQIATGMQYLHQQGIIHRDLAIRNVFVVQQSGDYNAKVGDFGMSRVVGDYYKLSENHEFPVRWSAPEIFTHQTFSKESDVWSFGVVLWETLEYGRQPYTEMDPQTVVREVLGGYRLTRPKNCSDEMWKIVILCWKEQPTERPKFDDLVKSLQAAL